MQLASCIRVDRASAEAVVATHLGVRVAGVRLPVGVRVGLAVLLLGAPPVLVAAVLLRRLRPRLLRLRGRRLLVVLRVVLALLRLRVLLLVLLLGLRRKGVEVNREITEVSLSQNIKVDTDGISLCCLFYVTVVFLLGFCTEQRLAQTRQDRRSGTICYTKLKDRENYRCHRIEIWNSFK